MYGIKNESLIHIKISDSSSKSYILYGRSMLYLLYRMHNLFRLFFQLLRNVFILYEILFREEATVYISNHKNHLRTQPFGSLAKTRCLAIRSFSPTLSLIFPKNSGICKPMVLKQSLIILLIKVDKNTFKFLLHKNFCKFFLWDDLISPMFTL